MIRPAMLLALCALTAAPAGANVLSGPATVIDGDTIDMTGTRIRLLGIDAPESAQSCTRAGQPWACGQDATATLQEILSRESLQCYAQGTDIYGRTLATCSTAIFDLGREMVRRGMALPTADAPPEYAEAQGIARQLGYGLWSGEFEVPSAWRAANPRLAPQPARPEVAMHRPARAAPQRARAASGERRFTNALGCAIKGNHSRYGGYIYHLPGQKYYDGTRPEALFCTESEAMAAGFRRSKE
jgi:endonuclease YncB( thermonuclease family)